VGGKKEGTYRGDETQAGTTTTMMMMIELTQVLQVKPSGQRWFQGRHHRHY